MDNPTSPQQHDRASLDSTTATAMTVPSSAALVVTSSPHHGLQLSHQHSSAPLLHPSHISSSPSLHGVSSMSSSLASLTNAPELHKVASVMSGEEADSEPSSAGSSIRGSREHLPLGNGNGSGERGGMLLRGRRRSESIDEDGMNTGMMSSPRHTRLASNDSLYLATTPQRRTSISQSQDDEADREVRAVTSGAAASSLSVPTSAQQPVGGKWKVSSSSLNLLLSSRLRDHFVPDTAVAPSTPIINPKWWRSLWPGTPLSNRSLTFYTLTSLASLWLVRAAMVRSRFNRTMVTFLVPFVVREAPHILFLLLTLGMIRTAPHVNFKNPSLILSWFANIASLCGLVGIARNIVRVGGTPFQQAMQQAQIEVPDMRQQDVLTIVPVQSQPDEQNKLTSESDERALMVSAFAETSDKDDTAAAAATASSSTSAASDALIPSSTDSTSTSSSSTCATAYSRIGRMTPLRWFLSVTQLTKTLAWFEEIQWKTGVVWEQIHTRQKTHALKLDIYRPKVSKPGTLLPIFLYIHGGGWITGHRSFHSLTLLYAVAKAGFCVVSINYRLSPWVKHPTHLMDCKRSLAWLRSHASSFGGDASFICVGGESAGAHLACLLALTPNILHLQPGFEHIDTSVQGVIDLYGCHDFTDSHLHFRSREDPTSLFGGFEIYLHRMVMGHSLTRAKELYQMASPIYRLQWFHTNDPLANIPPFFGAHGTHDDLVPIEDSEEFYKKLKEKRRLAKEEYEVAKRAYDEQIATLPSSATSHLLPPLPPLPINDVFVRVSEASHAFNNVISPRSFALNDSVTVWLTSLLKQLRLREAEVERRKEEHPSLYDYAMSETKFTAATATGISSASSAVRLEIVEAHEVSAPAMRTPSSSSSPATSLSLAAKL